MSGRALISGAGIAGCCLAWWLDRYGYDVTLVEQAAEPREGGYVIDFWGLGYTVAERMGLLDELGQHDLDVQDFIVIDDAGRRVSGINQGALQGLTGGRIMSLPRSSVALALYEAVKARATVRFGDGIADIRQDEHGAEVGFVAGGQGRYDLVFGADGLHSAVRRIVFGDESQFEQFLGYHVAAFTAHGFRHRDPHAYVAYGAPGRQIWRITLREDATVFLLVFAHADPIDASLHDSTGQKKVLARTFAGIGPQNDEMLAALEQATDLYFDRMSQITMPHWTSGRVALVGDACACPSLLAGEGSSMAMAEAYTLAGELHAANGDYRRAFPAYEQQLQPFVRRKQKAARGFASSFVPRTALGLWLRNTSLNVLSQLGLTRLAFGAQLQDSLQLGAYEQ